MGKYNVRLRISIYQYQMFPDVVNDVSIVPKIKYIL